ncbi:lactate utilization protein C [Schinkia azotoformans]|uniref:LutC/YkgG family protein n=1 Tax=Schinkia azotoformans TaxID=1454 RepID=UPI002DB82D6F|nr:lactate utilization protein C [Schinkia azotoformans]MEC1719194.1 lactate utilization protein C [Schinkia azotoformans]MED4353263.1 lactate utilization protein C [Schinkia azotoformans]MED4413400.1 lactate utilization protein C [Schinkia azotoformans]
MVGTIQNRDKFLNKIAGQLGRSRVSSQIESPTWKYRPQDKVFHDATQDELLDILKEQCKKIHTSLYITDIKDLSKVLTKVVNEYGGGPIVKWKDDRFTEWGLDPLIKEEWPNQNIDVHEWDYTKGDENVKVAENANVGITISEVTLAESGTVVLFSDKERGRTVGFLPSTYIALIPKSSIVARMTQGAQKIREVYEKTGYVPSCVNFISGPSNSADIELKLVVGVHGPFKASYIVINDL